MSGVVGFIVLIITYHIIEVPLLELGWQGPFLCALHMQSAKSLYVHYLF
jgi:hypothetical protein